MGSRFSRLKRSFTNLRNLARRLRNRSSTRRNMVSYAEILIERLKLGPTLRVKIRRIKNDTEAEGGSEADAEGNDVASNIDLLSGIGTQGTPNLDEFEFMEGSESESDLELQNDLEENPVAENDNNTVANTSAISSRLNRLIPGRRQNKHNSVVSNIAGKVMEKFQGGFKTVDVFMYEKRKSNRMSSSKLFLHALDCHDAVVELSAQLDFLTEKLAKQTKTATSSKIKQSDVKIIDRTLKSVKFHQPTNLIAPGTCLTGTIQIPTSIENVLSNEEARNNDNNSDPELLPAIQHRYSNLAPNFENLDAISRRPYDLTVLRQQTSEVGQVYWVGRHSTYQGKRDQQTVIITVDQTNIFYEDFETQCVGEIRNTEVVGNVHQLKQGQESFYESNEDNNQFKVERIQQSNAIEINDSRSKLYRARAARALSFAAWCGSGVSTSRIQNEKFLNRQIDWSEIVEDMIWLCDEVGATMRRYVYLLNELQFDSLQARKHMMEDLKNKGIGIAKVHEMWDAANLLLQAVREDTPSGSCHDNSRMQFVNNFHEKVTSRMQHSFNRFEKALRRAEVRVVTNLLKQWEVAYEPNLIKKLDSHSISSKNSSNKLGQKNKTKLSRDKTKSKQLITGKNLSNKHVRKTLNSKNSFSSLSTIHSIQSKPNLKDKSDRPVEKESIGSEEEPICVCCQNSFEKKMKMYVTPCKHAFHKECLMDWFKVKSVCPICRTDFSELDGGKL